MFFISGFEVSTYLSYIPLLITFTFHLVYTTFVVLIRVAFSRSKLNNVRNMMQNRKIKIYMYTNLRPPISVGQQEMKLYTFVRVPIWLYSDRRNLNSFTA
jgi:hypothetical protein